MKQILFITAVFFFTTGIISSQSVTENDSVEQKIRDLDLAHANAILHRDVTALSQLLAENVITNHPTNKIVKGRDGIFGLIGTGVINYSSFVREPEIIKIYKDMAVVMGNETLVLAGDAIKVEQTIHRRYTNIWMKEKDKWLLTIRHAHIICTD